MFSRKVVLTVLILFVGLVAVVPARAANITLFTNRAAFIAASTNLQNIDFEGIAPENSVLPGLTSLTLLGVTFSDSPNTISVVDDGFFRPLFDFGSGASLSGGVNITAMLPAGITAVGSDVMSALGNGPFVIVLSTGESFMVPTGSAPNRLFAGFTSDEAISFIIFNRTTALPLLDNFVFGQAGPGAAVPEPTTLGLFGWGLAAVAMKLRKRRKRGI
jgi:PEP-CTERM motif-containing protein